MLDSCLNADTMPTGQHTNSCTHLLAYDTQLHACLFGLYRYLGATAGTNPVQQDGGNSWCRLSTIHVSAFCWNNSLSCQSAASTLTPPGAAGEGWDVSDWRQVPPVFPAFAYYPIGQGGSLGRVESFGGANQPECFITEVTAVADSYIITAGGSGTVTVVQAPGVLQNDITPGFCRPLGPTPATATILTQPSGGTVTTASNGAFNYTRTAASPAATSFTYKITCGDKVSGSHQQE